MFTEKDYQQIAAKGLTPQQVEQQVNNFVTGFPFLDIDRAACVGDGIVSLDEAKAAEYAQRYESVLQGGGIEIEKFVPASGAATRMFKDIFEAVGSAQQNRVSQQTLDNIEKFAFVGELRECGVDFSDPQALLSAIVEQPLGYGKKPKALIKFHGDGAQGRTALEEQMVEGALYGATNDKPVNIHITVSPEHLPLFEAKVGETLEQYQNRYGVSYNISYSTQKSSTDTVAVDLENQPFRTGSGELLFRPSGHGALLENLSQIDADLIFIKTIDNVQPDHLKYDTVLYKKALAGMAIDVQQKIFDYIRSIDSGDADPEQVINFVEQNLGYRIGESTSFDHLREILNRPLRVCGMVRNEGEPGGGPFWVKSSDGSLSLQIAESSQISADQKSLMSGATHFNPVDLICMTRDIRGEKFVLSDFRDDATGFVSQKSFEGRSLQAQELPGLWNGAMARWNTVFVEVPISTFSPVKILTDLLRPQHQ
ncbi:MAG: DUF4301 family protein [Rikenellaceae bacterium]